MHAHNYYYYYFAKTSSNSTAQFDVEWAKKQRTPIFLLTSVHYVGGSFEAGTERYKKTMGTTREELRGYKQHHLRVMQ